MWIEIKQDCRSKWNPALTAGQQIDLDYDSAKQLIAEGKAFEIEPQISAEQGQAPIGRKINTTSPLAGGGDLSADRTLSIPKSDATHNGYLSSADWTSFNAGAGPAKIATLTLSETDIKALRAIPKQIVALVSGKVLVPLSLVLQYKKNTTAFTIGTGGNIALGYGAAPSTELPILVPATGLIDQAASQVAMAVAQAAAMVFAQAGVSAQPLVLWNDGAGEYTLGDGEVFATLHYIEVAIN